MPKVTVKPNEVIEAAFRRFKRAVEKSGILAKSRRSATHEKKSAKKKRKRAAAVKRHMKKMMRENVQTQQRQRERY